ncbi:putative ribonuclease H-like domain-containing protein [Tanacetum coccineum]
MNVYMLGSKEYIPSERNQERIYIGPVRNSVPQQNGVAERKNRTLIEAARTMLADSLLPIQFWAEAVNTACYVLNRVLVTKPQMKTPYEILMGRSPNISFMRPFGCSLTILNTLNHWKENYADSKEQGITCDDAEDLDDQQFIVPDHISALCLPWKVLLQKKLNCPLKIKLYMMRLQNRTNHKDQQTCLFACFLSQEEPKKVSQALADESWVEAMQEELLQFKLARGLGGYYLAQKAKGCLELNGNKNSFWHLHLSWAFLSIRWMSRVHFCMATSQKRHGYRRGAIDKTLFIKKDRRDIMLVQVYVDDIIFGSTKSSMVKDFEDLMQKEFKMSSMGELTFFLGLQVKQSNGAFSDSDYAGDNHDRRSTSGGCQYLGRRLVSWQCKKQTIVAISSTEAEYVAAASCCAQVLWMQNQLLDYGFNFMNTEIHIDNESTICIVKNPVFHSKTKHIQIRHHFIRDCYEQRLINVVKVHTDDNVADLLTKGFDLARFNFLVVTIGMMNP